jgi:hypothetical protein
MRHAPPLRVRRRFKSGDRFVVDLERPDGRRVWIFGATADEAETNAAAEIAVADKAVKP